MKKIYYMRILKVLKGFRTIMVNGVNFFDDVSDVACMNIFYPFKCISYPIRSYHKWPERYFITNS